MKNDLMRLPITASATPGASFLRLRQLASSIKATTRFEFPEIGRDRVRDLVKRSAPRPISIVPSWKLDRPVQCESALEADAVRLLDASSSVRWFCEQPLIVHYLQDRNWRYHVPDFVVETERTLELIEIKFSQDIDTEVLARTEILSSALRKYGITYRLITELELRNGHLLDSVDRVLRRGRQPAPPGWSLRAQHLLRQHDGLPLSHFGWTRSGCADAAHIARLILEGGASVSFASPLSATTAVRLTTSTIHKEDQPWLLAVSR
jgi:hypothetical protein